jgi:hypothetical protein
MATTKQHETEPASRQNYTVGKQHAIAVEVEGCTYQPTDMVPRHIAVKIAQIHNTDFSTAISKGRITPKGYGRNALFKVAECMAIAMGKRNYNKQQSNQAA